MAADAIITVENLGKKYRLGTSRSNERYTALRDVIADKARSVFARGRIAERETRNEGPEEFWALKDVSFEVKRGEVLGIIGRNGAGKSTLLKILSRITEPTEGRIRLEGRVASLLEVGTGFHPELTGRENIFLNGAILGMTRAEIKAKFDEIVAFAEVERFLDTPVKRYSSGMYVRLAFAVAAHLEPEILVVDEVLAVGDAEFQMKCVGKMQDVRRGGRTVIFVSHNMDAVLQLCTSALLLRSGRVDLVDGVSAVVGRYLRAGEDDSSFRLWRDSSRPGNHVVRLIGVRVHDREHYARHVYPVHAEVGISMTYEVLRDDALLTDNFNLFNDRGSLLFVVHNVRTNQYNQPRLPGIYISTAWIPANLLPEGTFFVSAAVISLFPFAVHFHEEQVISFHMADPQDGTTARGVLTGDFPGAVRPLVNWDISDDSARDLV